MAIPEAVGRHRLWQLSRGRLLWLLWQLLLSLCAICPALADTHWMITEAGRIESTTESYLNLAQPHDLVQFLRQEERVRKLRETKARLNSQKVRLDERESRDDPTLEQKIRENDPDCVRGGKPLNEHQIFKPIVLPLSRLGVDVLDYVHKSSPAKTESVNGPRCSHYLPVEFSLLTFDQLRGVQQRVNLTSLPPLSAHMQQLFLGGFSPLEMAHALQDVFSVHYAPGRGRARAHEDVWVVHYLALLYWFSIGEPRDAIECARTTLLLAPPQHRYAVIAALAEVLYTAGYAEDAAVAVRAAVASDEGGDLDVAALCGRIHAATMEYEQAHACFDLVLRMLDAPRAREYREKIETAQAALRCHQKVEAALESQHEQLQETLDHLHSYQSRLLNVQQLQQDILNHVSSKEELARHKVVWDYFNFGDLKGAKCSWQVADKGLRELQCQLHDLNAYKTASIGMWRKLKQQVRAASGDGGAAESPDDPVKSWRATASSDDDLEDVVSTASGDIASYSVGSAAEEKLSPPVSMDFDRELRFQQLLEQARPMVDSISMATKEHRYPTGATNPLPVSADWPSSRECLSNTTLPALFELDPVYVSPVDKGFELTRLLSIYLHLDERSSHPLPWYPPFCSILVPKPVDFHLQCCDHLLGVSRVKNFQSDVSPAATGSQSASGGGLSKLNLTELGLKAVLLEMAQSQSDSEAEVGQRIHTMLKHNLGPRWLLLALAALYWRQQGQVAESVSCLRLSLNERAGVPYADIALSQLAVLTYTAGRRLADATVLARHAVEVDDRIPSTQFLLGYLLAQSDELIAAQSHLERALRLEPSHRNSLLVLGVVRCLLRKLNFPPQTAPAAARTRTSPSTGPAIRERARVLSPPLTCSPADAPRFFCQKDSKGIELCYLEEKKQPGCERPAHPFASSYADAGEWDTSAMEHSENVDREMRDFAEEDDLRVLNLFDATYDPSPSSAMDDVELIEIADDAPAVASNADTAGAAADELDSRGGLSHAVVPPDSAEGSETRDAGEAELEWAMPEKLPVPTFAMVQKGLKNYQLPSIHVSDCQHMLNKAKLSQPASTWLALSAKGLQLDDYLDWHQPISSREEPVCPDRGIGGLRSLDHLPGAFLNSSLSYRPELGLKDAFSQLNPYARESMEMTAWRLGRALRQPTAKKVMRRLENRFHWFEPESGPSWVLASAASLYWRIQGNASMAQRCLRYSLHFAPVEYRDLALIGLANVYQYTGFVKSALVVAGQALQHSPDFVVVHFTLANIYSVMQDWSNANHFFYSTLALQPNFEPARDRVKAVACMALRMYSGGPAAKFDKPQDEALVLELGYAGRAVKS